MKITIETRGGKKFAPLKDLKARRIEKSRERLLRHDLALEFEEAFDRKPTEEELQELIEETSAE